MQSPLEDLVFENYAVADFAESKAADVTAWKLARSAIEYENHLINHRLTWFFSAQAFLLTALFVVLTAPATSLLRRDDGVVILPIVFFLIGFLAIFMCAATSNGLDRAYLALDRVTRHYVRMAKAHGFKRMPPLHAWGKPGLLNTLYIPRVTIGVWIALELVCTLAFAENPFNGLAKSLSLDNYLAIASLIVSVFGVVTSIYLAKARAAARGEEKRYWEVDPEGAFFNPDHAEEAPR